MHAISSYRDNRPTNTQTHKQTHRQDRLQYSAPQLARNVLTQITALQIAFVKSSYAVYEYYMLIAEQLCYFHYRYLVVNT